MGTREARERAAWAFRARSTASVLCVLAAGCASTPERATRAALAGDTAALDGVLKSGSREVDIPFALEQPGSACPGHRTLTPLQAAACAGHEAAVKKLLASGAGIDLATGAGQAPLLLAVSHGRDAVARLLIESQANLEVTDDRGNTALMLCAWRGDAALAHLLLKSGASPNAANAAGETALLLSTDAGLSKMLVGLGADPLAVSARGETGLHFAARSGNVETARFFLERGVDPGFRSAAGATALEIARGEARSEAPPAARASPRASRAAALAARRGAPAGASRAPAPADPEPGRGPRQAAVAALLEEWIDQAVRQDAAAAEQAAAKGESAEALERYAAAISKASDHRLQAAEDELRVKVVQYAASLPQPAGIPEKAREHLVRSSYLLKKGQDLGLVEGEMHAALRLAPWWAEGYYNLGQLQAQQGKFDRAERSLKLFIAGAPTDPRAQAAQDKIYEIGIAREEDGKYRGMQGRWVDEAGRGYSVSLEGEKVHIRSDAGLAFTVTHKNGAVEGSVEGQSYPGEHGCTIPGQMHPVNGRVAPDARAISLEHLWSTHKTSFHCVNMAGVPTANCCILCEEVCDAVTVSGTSRMSVRLTPAQ